MNYRLAYLSEAMVNWCPSCQTVLANEELDGVECERCGSLVEAKAAVEPLSVDIRGAKIALHPVKPPFVPLKKS